MLSEFSCNRPQKWKFLSPCQWGPALLFCQQTAGLSACVCHTGHTTQNLSPVTSQSKPTQSMQLTRLLFAVWFQQRCTIQRCTIHTISTSKIKYSSNLLAVIYVSLYMSVIWATYFDLLPMDFCLFGGQQRFWRTKGSLRPPPLS